MDSQDVLQRSMNRMEFIEQRVEFEHGDEVSRWATVVDNMQHARRLEAQDSLAADAAAAAQRPEPARAPAPTPASVPAQVPASHRGPGALPDPAVPVATQEGSKKAFSNALVKAKS